MTLNEKYYVFIGKHLIYERIENNNNNNNTLNTFYPFENFLVSLNKNMHKTF